MAAPSSAKIKPSAMASIAPRSQPMIAWGPPTAAIISGIVTNGPIPHIWVMFTAIADPSPNARVNCGAEGAGACISYGSTGRGVALMPDPPSQAPDYPLDNRPSLAAQLEFAT